MKKFFTVSQTAKTVRMTAETLRHYDRIGLIKPCKIDEWTGYRYYSEQEIVRLNTVSALRCMDLSLIEIKKILEYDDFEKIVNFLKHAEKKADGKMAELSAAKCKIQSARRFYESKMDSKTQKEVFIKNFPQRVILLSENLQEPSLDNLWDYHRHFYAQVGQEKREEFRFEDLAGIYETCGKTNLFAVCTQYCKVDGLKVLPQGNYLCADCTENSRGQVLLNLLDTAKNKYGVEPDFTLQIIVLSGILQWNYQIQILVRLG